MKSLSLRSQAIQPSPTVSIDARYKEYLAQGRPMLSLGAGEPDLKMPEQGVAALLQALKEGKTRYGHMAGQAELRSALSQKFWVENEIRYDSEDILITSGAKQALFLALLAVLEPGDEVIIPSPYWVTYPEAVRLLGGVPIVVETHMAQGFKMTPSSLRDALTPRTKVLILNSPCNPTGAVYSLPEMNALCQIVLEYDLYLISDEIYEHIVFDEGKCFSPASLSPELLSRTATVNGFSKCYAMQGLRLGYVGAPQKWIKAMIASQSHTAHHPSTLSQYAALGCLGAAQSVLPQAKSHYQKARDFAVAKIGTIRGTSFLKPAGSFYIFLSVEGLLTLRPQSSGSNSSQRLAEYLLEKWNLVTIPGEGFGRPGYLRLSFANSLNSLEMAIEQLRQGLEAFAKV